MSESDGGLGGCSEALGVSSFPGSTFFSSLVYELRVWGRGAKGRNEVKTVEVRQGMPSSPTVMRVSKERRGVRVLRALPAEIC